eukprot:gene7699-12165_t
MFNYFVSASPPSAIHISDTGNFSSTDELNLITSKGNFIEIYQVSKEGLSSTLQVPIYGNISSMKLFRLPNEKQDSLFILTDRKDMCIIKQDEKTGQIITTATGDVKDKIGKEAENGQIGIVNTEGTLIGLHIYDGVFKVVPIIDGIVQEAFNMRIEELNIFDIIFLEGYVQNKKMKNCSIPTIAVLYEDSKNAKHIKSYGVDIKQKELLETSFFQSNIEFSTEKLYPVPLPIGGVIFFSENSITYHNGSSFKSIQMKKQTKWTSAGKIDKNGSRWLCGDITGKLFVLTLLIDNNEVKQLKLQEMGKTSISSSISYLDQGFVFIGSRFGDSQLIKLRSKPIDESYVEVIEDWTNIGPILDFSIIDLDQQGDSQILTASGGYSDGSLRIVRNGVGIEEQASLDLDGIKQMWSLKSTFSSKFEKYLVMSFIGETRILGIENEDLSEVDNLPFDQNVPTVACGTTLSNSHVQITSKFIRLIDCESFNIVDEWKTPNDSSINLASMNPSQIVISLSNGELIYFKVDKKIKKEKSIKLDTEISCLDIHPLKNENKTNLLAIGLWNDFTIRLFDLDSLKEIGNYKLDIEVLPRSLLFITFDKIDYLFCGLGEGSLISYKINSSNELHAKKKVNIGTKPITLHPFYLGENLNVFACSDRPSVIYSNNEKLLFSNVNLKDVNAMCPFNDENFSDCLALSNDKSLIIGNVDSIQKLHIRTIPLNEQPRRVSYQQSSHTILATTSKTFEDTNLENQYVKIFDGQTHEVLNEYQLDKTECASSSMNLKFKDDDKEYFVVGTAYVNPDEIEPTKGRLLVFEVKNSKLHLVAQKDVSGAVYSMDSFKEKLLVGVNQTIQIFQWVINDDDRELIEECSHNGYILNLKIKSRGDFFIVGDLMKSISLYVYKQDESSIELIAQDYNQNWVTACEMIDENTFITCDNHFNIRTFTKNDESTEDEERKKLVPTGMFHLGTYVNSITKGSLKSIPIENDYSNIPTLVLGTIHGSIGVIARLPKKLFEIFEDVQQALRSVIKGIGGFSHEKYRSLNGSNEPSKHFVDGDLIETFLELEKSEMKKKLIN